MHRYLIDVFPIRVRKFTYKGNTEGLSIEVKGGWRGRLPSQLPT